jgi:DNA ligase D-like protein (predicted ligase)
MLAGSGTPFDSDKHLFEIKWDGIRVLAFFGEGVHRLQGRKLTDASERYPEIMGALEALPGDGILDGEVVVLDPDGRPDFQRVLVREQTTTRDAAALVKASRHPVVYMAFDLLYRNGEPLFDRPLIQRKKLLTELLVSPPSPIVESTYVLHRGKALFKEAEARGLEGVIAKAISSRYVGERSNEWLKIKVRHRTDAVLIGIVRERGTRRVKSLVLGAYDGEDLVWLGNAGSGLDEKTVHQLGTELGPLSAAAPPNFLAEAPGDIEWLRPALVVRIEYSELTRDARLRHPVFIGFVNKNPTDCLRPERS